VEPKLAEKAAAALQAFDAALADDLNMPQAMAVVWEFLRSSNSPGEKKAFLESADQVLGLKLFERRETAALPSEALQLIEERERARRNKDFAQSDVLRKRLAELGVLIKDTPKGPEWKLEPKG
jgi:cysteinyl-tRNA synthetase